MVTDVSQDTRDIAPAPEPTALARAPLALRFLAGGIRPPIRVDGRGCQPSLCGR
jgi:hypothetical protein